MPSADPKHGRWILPVIIAGMILLTYTFVSNLEPSEGIQVTTTTAPPPFPTEPSTTTSTLPPDLAAFMVTVEAFATQAQGFAQQIGEINDAWEARDAGFTETRTAFNNVRATVALWEDQVASAAADAPPPLAQPYVTLVTEVAGLAPAIADIILGLEAPDTGQLRREAVEIWEREMQEVLDAFQAIRDAAVAAAGTGDDTEGEQD